MVRLAGAEGGQAIVQSTNLDSDGIQMLALSDGIVVNSSRTSVDGNVEGLDAMEGRIGQFRESYFKRVQGCQLKKSRGGA